MGKVFPLLYWIGLLITLVGMILRFWLGMWTTGLALALTGLALLLAARIAQALRRARGPAVRDHKIH